MQEDNVLQDFFPYIYGEFDFPCEKNVVFDNLTYEDKEQKERTSFVQASYIIPCKTEAYPALPNFSFEAKGPTGTEAVIRRQACYNGVLGARAMQKLRDYAKGGDGPVYEAKADAIVCTYLDETLKIYTFHLAPPVSPGEDPNYCMTLLCGFVMDNSADSFRQGASALHNLRVWASEQRMQAITAANDRAATLSTMPSPPLPPSAVASSALGTPARAEFAPGDATVSPATNRRRRQCPYWLRRTMRMPRPASSRNPSRAVKNNSEAVELVCSGG
ncbi:MAG: hypothetical protein M1826_002757 [Phylliscum demangeonii]|nr:MAG: hypothetical protein M1826_002757 [Phylliscum demangeonii]